MQYTIGKDLILLGDITPEGYSDNNKLYTQQCMSNIIQEIAEHRTDYLGHTELHIPVSIWYEGGSVIPHHIDVGNNIWKSELVHTSLMELWDEDNRGFNLRPTLTEEDSPYYHQMVRGGLFDRLNYISEIEEDDQMNSDVLIPGWTEMLLTNMLKSTELKDYSTPKDHIFALLKGEDNWYLGNLDLENEILIMFTLIPKTLYLNAYKKAINSRYGDVEDKADTYFTELEDNLETYKYKFTPFRKTNVLRQDCTDPEMYLESEYSITRDVVTYLNSIGKEQEAQQVLASL